MNEVEMPYLQSMLTKVKNNVYQRCVSNPLQKKRKELVIQNGIEGIQPITIKGQTVEWLMILNTLAHILMANLLLRKTLILSEVFSMALPATKA